MDDYQVIESRIIFDHPGITILSDTVDHLGMLHAYLYLVSPVDSVATVGITDAQEIILTRQYRHPVGQVIYDLPAGRLEPGENPEDGARREFEEETGYYPRHIEQIGSYNEFPGTLRAKITLFFASDLMQTRQNLNEGEELETVFMSIEEVLHMILNGEVIDGSLQLGMLLALQKGLISARSR
jgi:ADP-ribose pyrophosphatase